MPKLDVPAHMFTSPRKFVSDGRYSPEGTISFRHDITIDGQSAKLYADEDLTSGLNGSRSQLDKGNPVPVTASLEVAVGSTGKLYVRLSELSDRK